jgi:hypothetical protein
MKLLLENLTTIYYGGLVGVSLIGYWLVERSNTRHKRRW